jgi:hypothetical protein
MSKSLQHVKYYEESINSSMERSLTQVEVLYVQTSTFVLVPLNLSLASLEGDVVMTSVPPLPLEYRRLLAA